MTIKRSFHGLQCGLKGRGKEEDQCFGNVELKAMKSMEQPTLDQKSIKSTKTLTPIEIFPQIEANELEPFIYLFILNFSFFSSFLFFGFFFFPQMEKKHQKAKFHEFTTDNLKYVNNPK